MVYFMLIVMIMLCALDGSIFSLISLPSVLEDDGKTAAEKCEQFKSLNVFGRLRGFIYHELFTKIYCPQFHNSPQVGSLLMSCDHILCHVTVTCSSMGST